MKLIGDISGDGQISSTDCILLKAKLLGMISFADRELIYGDIDDDSDLTTGDYLLLKQHLSGKDEIIPR